MNTVHFETTLCNFLDRYLVDRDCIDIPVGGINLVHT